MQYKNEVIEFPLVNKISFRKVIETYEKSVKSKNKAIANKAKLILDEVSKYPKLREGLEDMDELRKYQPQVDLLINDLFPDSLRSNEIKAAAAPFSFDPFYMSDRLQNIILNAGEACDIEMRNFDEETMYIMGCVIILNLYYGYNVNFKRPLFFDVPDKKTGLITHYRVLMNADFSDISPRDNAKEIKPEDVEILIDNFHNLDLWKEYFPPNSWNFRGFGIINMFDVTMEESLSALKTNLLRKKEDSVQNVTNNLRNLFRIPDLTMGFVSYNAQTKLFRKVHNPDIVNYVIQDDESININEVLCDESYDKIVNKREKLILSDVQKMSAESKDNVLFKTLLKKKVGSYMLIPMFHQDELLGIMELASKKKHTLNTLSANKLKDVIPEFTTAMKRAKEEFETKMEAIIQEECTSIHPSVEWRFRQEAQRFYNKRMMEGSAQFKNLIFKEVYPLYGQLDIRGSSELRNKAVSADLQEQLKMVVSVLTKVKDVENLTIYDELAFRIKEYMTSLKKGIEAASEHNILNFLSSDIYPIFKHIRTLSPMMEKLVNDYEDALDPKLHMIYNKRKDYDDSVAQLNIALTTHLDEEQHIAQEMFPHFFERFKTDGVEYNMYIGQSLVQNQKFDEVYLYNLRLWQLQMMCEMEVQYNGLKKTMNTPLDVASLILVYNNSLSIHFRTDEKRFDVDGAYNARYEIIKKRIDKANIKGTDERITQPGKIAIVYSRDENATEYKKYIKFLQSKNYLKDTVEDVALDELQGVSGLRALRVEVNFSMKPEESRKFTYNDLMEAVK
jgi:hypothetical protein